MKIIQIVHVIIILLLALSIHSEQPYIKIVHNIDPMAKCLDGSPASIY